MAKTLLLLLCLLPCRLWAAEKVALGVVAAELLEQFRPERWPK